MAPNGRSNIHADAYMTDSYTWGGPLGNGIQVTSTFQSADCASLTFDSAGNLVTICVGLEGPRLMMFDPVSLETLGQLSLPPRDPACGSSVFTDFSGGGYFYLDDQDRAVVPTTTREIWIVAETGLPWPAPGFELQQAYDLSSAVPPDDCVISVLPDWSGRLWFATVHGVVGTVDPVTGAVASVTLGGEAIGNSFAVDETGGVFVVSDHAMYRFDPDPATGAPVQTWRETYDRGTRLKPGQTNFGSGTTPTLIGSQYLAITDNADPFMHVVVFRREAQVSGTRLVCQVPVFGATRGATENSLIAAGPSLVVENNYGYTGPSSTMNGGVTEPGVARVDIAANGSGCRKRWTNDAERIPTTVSKVSLATGLIYAYTKPPESNGADAWYLTAIDFRNGHTVYSQLAGTDLGFNNNYAPVTLGSDGAAYVGALGGLVELRDAG